MKLRKETIKKVLATEPLAGGNWWFPTDTSDLEGCSVCAVGAIVRHALLKKKMPLEGLPILCGIATAGRTGAGSKKLIEEVLAKGNYMGALSMYLEGRTTAYGTPITKRLRNSLIKFVDKNFPNTVEVTI